MWLPSKKQVDTATRYTGVIIATSFTIFGLQAKGFDLQQVMGAVAQLGDTVNTIIPAISAAYAGYLAVRGIISASPANQIASVREIANDPSKVGNDTAKIALLDATSSVLSQPYAATGLVVDASQATKVALLDATAAIPEVVDPIHVTDQRLVDATVSTQVVKTEGMKN